MKNTIKWTCTDPDQHQYGRKISPGVYEFREFDRAEHGGYEELYDSTKDFIEAVWDELMWNEATIVLSHYTEQEMRRALGGYYHEKEVTEMISNFNEDDQWIIAECLFEQQ